MQTKMGKNPMRRQLNCRVLDVCLFHCFFYKNTTEYPSAAVSEISTLNFPEKHIFLFT